MLTTEGRRSAILIRNTETGEYFAGLDLWTRDESQAMDFETVERALQYIRNTSGKDRVVLSVAAVPAKRLKPVAYDWIDLVYALQDYRGQEAASARKKPPVSERL